jgi:hypothetical protein
VGSLRHVGVLGSLLLAVCALVVPASAPAALETSMALKAAISTCAVTSVNVSSAGLLIAKGGCRVGARAVPAKLSVSYVGYDTDGFSCGLASSIGGTSLRLAPVGIAKSAGSVRFVPKIRGRYVSKAKKFSAVLTGSADLQCGKPVNLPPESVLCDRSQWPDGGWGTPTPNCGVSVGDYAFASLPRFDPQTGTFSAPHVVSPAGHCTYRPWTDSLGPGPFEMRDGYAVPSGSSPNGNPGIVFKRWLLDCGSGNVVQVSIEGFWLSDSGGHACAWRNVGYSAQRWVTIPTSWSGTAWGLVSVEVGEAGFAAIETATLRFRLPGTQYQC